MSCTTFQTQLVCIMKVLAEAAVEELGRLLDESSAAVLPLETAHLTTNSNLKRKLQREHIAKTVSLINYLAVADVSQS